MKIRPGVLPKDFKHYSRSKLDREDLKELVRTILSAIFMVMALGLCLFAAATVPEPQSLEQVTRKGGGQIVSSYPVAARRQSNP